ncbi:uncharacterized protein LOC127851536 [Dreissena polymorpha]|uniref:uncharacterized protein LOC127851536 n=1 Tax=Dreissena polymorpha TaxID=45954 RepID=UPI0022641A93|nr:uncharacterized protein LOC127851536 [Dreissena polymorpha]
MQSTTFAFLATAVCVYITTYISTAYGYKCSGPWAIHACYGGNGKRSGLPTFKSDLESDELKNRQNILRQLLFPDTLLPSVSHKKDMLSESSDIEDDVNSLFPELEDYDRSRDMAKARNLLSEMLLQKRQRNSLDSNFMFSR